MQKVLLNLWMLTTSNNDFPGIAPGLFALRGGENMAGKTLNLKIYVTGENLEKLEQIREHLNSKNDFGQL